MRVLIADDHDLLRDTLVLYLQSENGIQADAVGTLGEAQKHIADNDPYDLDLLDYNMPGMNGLQGLERACKSYPATKVALMSGVANRDVANEAMKHHARGFIPKSLSAVSFINAIKFILSGERYLPFDLVSSAPASKNHDDFTNVSAREMQTLEQLCIGLSNKEIARNLDIQEVTVKLHVKNIFSKLGVSNRTQAALFAKERYLF